MNPHATLTALALALASCASDPFRGTRATRVSREQRVTAGSAPTDAYFTAVFGHQRALAVIDLRRARLFAGLARSLEIREDADRDALATALRAALDRHQLDHVGVRFRWRPESTVLVEEWFSSVSADPPRGGDIARAMDEHYAALVDSIQVELSPPRAVAELAHVFDDLVALLRDAEATRRCMERLAGDPAAALTPDDDLRRGRAPSLVPEFRDAQRFVLGVRARATFHAQESVRIERLLVGALQPENDDQEEPTSPEEQRDSVETTPQPAEGPPPPPAVVR